MRKHESENVSDSDFKVKPLMIVNGIPSGSDTQLLTAGRTVRRQIGALDS